MFERRLLLKTCGMVPLLPYASGAIFRGQDLEPHFFLHIHVMGGVDTSYFFDARPRVFTAKGKIQNYHPGDREPQRWVDQEGRSCLVAPAGQQLADFRGDVTILNGVHMNLSFDGHGQNLNDLVTGSPFGGEYFLPYFRRGSGHSLEFVTMGDVFIDITNGGGSLALTPDGAKSMVALATSLGHQGASGMPIVLNRLEDLGGRSDDDGLSLGARSMKRGIQHSDEIIQRFRRLRLEIDPDPVLTQCRLVGQIFSRKLASGIFWPIYGDIDVHDTGSAQLQPVTYDAIGTQLAGIFRFLKTTPFDGERSFLDVTTVMIGSEFSRTMRQLGNPVEATGTDHNSLANSLILGGKGVKGNQILGATDLAKMDRSGKILDASSIHHSLDPHLIKAMGKPFDFETGRSRIEPSVDYQRSNYLTMESVANTVYEVLNLPSEFPRRRNGGDTAPVIPQVFSS